MKVSKEMVNTYVVLQQKGLYYRLHSELWTEKELASFELFHDITSEITSCANCPYHKACEKNELYYGCSVWENEMGEDL